MLIRGGWATDPAGAVRPTLRFQLHSAAGDLVLFRAVVDTGADRTVLDYRVLDELGFDYAPSGVTLGGVGGELDTVVVPGPLLFPDTGGAPATIHGQILAFPEPSGLDLSLIGRDILDNFAVILDMPFAAVALVSPPHRYVIHAS